MTALPNIAKTIATIERNLSASEYAAKLSNGEIEICWICGLPEPHKSTVCRAEVDRQKEAENNRLGGIREPERR